jgi:hypothetical protein
MIEIHKYNTLNDSEEIQNYDETLFAQGDINFSKKYIHYLNLYAEKGFTYWFVK